MAGAEGGHKFDHVVSVMFENRSFDNLLGRLYEPGEVPSFEGVIGKDLSNPIPECFSHSLPPVPKWRYWQTRMVQVHVPARVWGFESLLRHHRF